MSRLKDLYQKETIGKLIEELGSKNKNEVPGISKVVLNVGMGEAVSDHKIIDKVMENLAKIAGQKPALTRAKKSIAGFKVREGAQIGAKVTLRGKMMYEFLDRLRSIVLPRVRDFRGLNTDAFDNQGNYNLGLKEISFFPEISEEELSYPFGVVVTIVTTTKDKNKAKRLLELIGFPFLKD